MVTSEKKQASKASSGSGQDTGSASVQITQLTKHISELTEHLKVNKKDFAARRGLLQSVGRRRRLLRYLSERDSQAYLALIQKLGLRK